jgi:hypothetical protein
MTAKAACPNRAMTLIAFMGAYSVGLTDRTVIRLHRLRTNNKRNT